MLAVIEAIEKDEDREYVIRLYNAYKDIIVRIINKKVKDKNAIEDLLQETFVRIIRNLDKIKELSEYKVKPYLGTVTENVCMDYLRKKKKLEENEFSEENNVLEHFPAKDFNPEQMLENHVLRDTLWEKLKLLEERDRNIILYQFAYDMSYEEIAKELGMQKGQVGTYVKRAKDKLKKIILGEEGEL